MKFGVLLATEMAAGTDPDIFLDEILDQAKAAKESGFDSVWFGHHYLAALPKFQPLLVMARVLEQVKGMEIATGIFLLPFQNPIDIAEQLTTLDRLSGGLLRFGVGLGHSNEENRAFKITKKQAVGRMEEMIPLLRRLWTEDSVTHKGKYFDLEDVRMTLKPKQKGGIPILVGGDFEPGLRRAAKYGDAWLPSPRAGPEHLSNQLQFYKQELQKLGKPFPKEFYLQREIYIDSDRERAERDAKKYMQWHYVHTRDGRIKELDPRRFIVGDPAKVTSTIQEYKNKFPVTHMVFMIRWPEMTSEKVVNGIRTLGKEVIPHFK